MNRDEIVSYMISEVENILRKEQLESGKDMHDKKSVVNEIIKALNEVMKDEN